MIWLVFLSEPLTASLAADAVPLRVLGVAGVAGVCAIFVYGCFSFRFALLPLRRAVLLIALQTAFVVPTALAAQEHGLVGLVFVAVTAVFLLRRPVSLALVGVVAGLLVVIPRLVPGWETEDNSALSAVLGGVAVFGFTQLVVRNRQLARAHEEVAALAAAQERERLARDVHDVVGHSLTVVSVKAELAAKLLRPNPDAAAAELADIQRLARSALADVRSMVTGAREVTLAGELAAARSALDAGGVEARLPTAVDVVAPERQEIFAWALREGTTNVLRHSLARRVVVTLSADEIVMDDDGRGPGGDAARDGNGLRGLAERARAAGAWLVTGRSPMAGFRLAVRFPPDGRIGA
jgi:two-component system sensor histidine kinase DesK